MNLITAPTNRMLAKERGAFYTPPEVAGFLVRWAVRSPGEVVFDPGFGGGIFLQAAAERISNLGGDPRTSVFGVELDRDAHTAVSTALTPDPLHRRNLRCGDFFTLEAQFRHQADAVVGNPPFIRYQQFNGAARIRAGAVMQRENVRVTDLASSWAAFVVAGAALLRPGGRLAMVVPMELCHAAYAVPVLAYLSRSFASVQFVSFADRIFPQLSQDILLLLADEKGSGNAEFRWKHIGSAGALGAIPDGQTRLRRATWLDADAIASGRRRLIEQFMPKKTRKLYGELRRHPLVHCLGALADVGIGYVTGANEFFHLSEEAAGSWEIPRDILNPAVCRGGALKGLRFTSSDWKSGLGDGSTAHLLWVRPGTSVSPALRRYFEHGEAQGYPTAYKCRMRVPWYCVPHVVKPDAFLTYMSGISPRIAVNDVGAVAPNTLHVIRMLPMSQATASALSVGWQTSLTELSAELEGHAMGGGMLKLEPTEAGRGLVALPASGALCDLCESLDRIARHAASGTVRSTVDRMILRDQLGLSESDCRALRQAAEMLRRRRYSPAGKQKTLSRTARRIPHG